MECYTCKSNSGERRISPAPTIYEGKYWLVEHVYPTKLKGWIVIVTKRHVEALHELTKDEFAEFAEICEAAAKALYQLSGCEKEYCMCYAEVEHFQHIHFHVVPKPHDLPDEAKGSKIFSLNRIEEKDAVPRKDIIEFCAELSAKLNIN